MLKPNSFENGECWLAAYADEPTTKRDDREMHDISGFLLPE
jgi:hypothetical protein